MNAPPVLAEELSNLLREVSRSFNLTLRVLPGRIRPQIGLAYLLARTSDTIADTQLIPLEGRMEALATFRSRIGGGSKLPLNFVAFAQQQQASAERVLLEKCEELLASLDRLDAADRERIAHVLDTITSGQELDLRRFANASSQRVVALNTDEELDDYTYRVAGCVGEFWTQMCRAHLFAEDRLDDAFLLLNGVRFGKGLQLVNILRDLAGDLRQGRCYLPHEKLAAAGLDPAELLEPGNEPRVRHLYNGYVDRAEAHLRAGWAYTNALPLRSARVRLACAWPILIGFETLRRLRTGNILDVTRRIKMPRAAVKSAIVRSVLLYPFPGAWKRMLPSVQ